MIIETYQIAEVINLKKIKGEYTNSCLIILILIEVAHVLFEWIF